MSYILRTKAFKLNGEVMYGFADGLRDKFDSHRYIGMCIDTSHKIKWAQTWDDLEEIREYKELWDKEDEFDIVEYEVATKEYYGGSGVSDERN